MQRINIKVHKLTLVSHILQMPLDRIHNDICMFVLIYFCVHLVIYTYLHTWIKRLFLWHRILAKNLLWHSLIELSMLALCQFMRQVKVDQLMWLLLFFFYILCAIRVNCWINGIWDDSHTCDEFGFKLS